MSDTGIALPRGIRQLICQSLNLARGLLAKDLCESSMIVRPLES